MAEIDERLTPILDAVLRSPLEPLGRRALERLESTDAQNLIIEGEHDPFAAPPDEGRDERAHRQLRILDAVIGGGLKFELSLMEASLGLSKQIAAGMRDRGPEAFATVIVVDDTERLIRGRPGGENLLTGARRERLERTLKVWKRAVAAIEGSLGSTLES